MSDRTARAVVLGGSIAGLIAARVLTDTFDEVIVVERDRLDDTRQPRKGVPQGRHVHGIYSTGLAILEGLFPGLRETLLAEGAVEADMGSEFRWWHWGGFRTPEPAGIRAMLQSRPMLEQQLRRRVRALPRVQVRDDTDVVALVADASSARVTGVRVRDRSDGQGETILTADLVVDATGRGSRAPRWMTELGYPPPPETELPIDLSYATRIYRRRPSDLGSYKAMVISPAGPSERRVGVLFPVEGDRWSAMLGGWVGDHPPLDEAGWLAFAKGLPTPEMHRLLLTAEPLGDIVQHRFPSNLRRHWERLRRWPERFVVLGDAMCSFNPAYGQGMTVASFECRALGECVADGLDGLPARFYRRAGAIVDRAWTLAAGEDLRFPEVTGTRPFGSAFMNRYIARLHQASHYDGAAQRGLLEVMALLRPPPALMRPGLLLRAWLNGPAPAPPVRNETARKRVCVVGAGPAGLVAVKELLDEGHEPCCFEKSTTFGGVFNPPPEGRSYEQLRLTVSNYFMAYSSLAPEASEARRYWTREEYKAYLARFVARFDLAPHIALGAQIDRIVPTAEGRYRVRGVRGGEAFEDTFDAVAVCTGSHRVPFRPRFEGEATFRGRILHSADFRRGEDFAGQRVVCVGAGETAVDVAKLISDHAAACWMSFRRYQGIIARYPKGREHTNDSYSSRVQHALPLHVLFSEWLVGITTPADGRLDAAARFVRDWNQRSGGVGQFFTKSDVFVPNVLDGKLALKPHAIARLDGDDVVFTDGSRVTADAIVCCTGYHESLDAIEDHPVANARQLYKHMIHPRLPGVAFLGWARPALGGIPATAEMQARYFALLLSGAKTLPPPDALEAITRREGLIETMMFDLQPGLSTLVHYSLFMNAMADLIGCQVRPLRLLSRPELLFKTYFGSNIGATYRLDGPHSDRRAATEVILRLPVAFSRSEILRHSVSAALNRLAMPLGMMYLNRKARQQEAALAPAAPSRTHRARPHEGTAREAEPA